MRSTHTPPLTVTCAEWQPQEYITLRTTITSGDRQWINAHCMKSIVDDTSPNGVRIDMDAVASMQATIAKMAIAWQLYQDREDAFHHPIYADDNKTVLQDPIPFPTDTIDNAEARLALIQDWPDEDVQHVFSAFSAPLPKPMTEQQTNDFLATANGHSSTNLETASQSLSQ